MDGLSDGRMAAEHETGRPEVAVGDVPEAVIEELREALPVLITGERADAYLSRVLNRAGYICARVATAWEAACGPSELAEAHECRWRTMSVQYRTVKVNILMSVEATQTLVLQLCEGCGTYRTLTVDGRWTLADLDSGRAGGPTVRG